MSNALAIINNFDDLERMGKMMATSGLFSAKDAMKAMVQIQAGQEFGLSPFQSMSGIHIIKGKPVLSAGAMAALIKGHPDYNYAVTSHTNQECSIEFQELGKTVGVSSFSMDDARRAGLLNNPTWNKFPKNMLFARALSNGAKWYCAGIFGGSVYVEGEIPEAEVVNVTPNQVATRTGQTGNEVVEGEYTEFEPVRPDPEGKQWYNSLSHIEKQIAQGKWIESVIAISRYDHINAVKSAASKFVNAGIDNYMLAKRDNMTQDEKRTAFKLRVQLFSVIKSYAELRDDGTNEYDAIMRVREMFADTLPIVEFFKPVATDSFDDIPSEGERRAKQQTLIGTPAPNAQVNS